MPEPDRAETDLAGLLREAALLQQDALRGALIADIPEAPVIVDCDAGMMRQALTNLLKNAGEALDERAAAPPEGWHPEVRVSLTLEAEAVAIRIIDNGPGLPADRSRLFDPYVTLKAHGTGLGLPIVKKIVEEHGGSLILTDAPDRGETGTGAMAEIRLPRERHPVRAAQRKSRHDKDEAGPT
jgi:two-component system nitrogen regulation sensor histidine kinase NtrY